MGREDLIKHIIDKSNEIMVECNLADVELLIDLMVMVFTHEAADKGKCIEIEVADRRLINSLLRVGLVEYSSESGLYTIKEKDEYNKLMNKVLEKIAV